MNPPPSDDAQDMDTRLRLLEVSEALTTKRLDDHQQTLGDLSVSVQGITDRLASMEKKLVACAVLLAVAISGKADVAAALNAAV